MLNKKMITAAVISAVGIGAILAARQILIKPMNNLPQKSFNAIKGQNTTPSAGGMNATAEILKELSKIKNSEVETVEEPAPDFISLGVFELTGYCDCEICCQQYAGAMTTATGTTPTEGRTIAADPNVLEYGTVVYIDGHAYTVEDCGGLVKENRIEIYFNNHADAVAFGRQEKEIFVEVIK